MNSTENIQKAKYKRKLKKKLTHIENALKALCYSQEEVAQTRYLEKKMPLIYSLIDVVKGQLDVLKY